MARFPCNVTLTVYPNQHIQLAQADVINLRREDLVIIWKVRRHFEFAFFPSPDVQNFSCLSLLSDQPLPVSG